jgi:hypothetical protein
LAPEEATVRVVNGANRDRYPYAENMKDTAPFIILLAQQMLI